MYYFEGSEGEGNEKVTLRALEMGDGFVVMIFNEGGAHIGAVALGDFDPETSRASVSLMTRRGHKDDKVAYDVAYKLARFKRKPVCVICGLHIDNMTTEQMEQLLQNVAKATERVLESI